MLRKSLQNNNYHITLLYHDVTDNRSDTGFQSSSAKKYSTNTADFEKHLNIITNHNNIGLFTSIDDYFNETGVVALTFDDGGSSFVYIADTLSSFGLKGIFFICTKYIGRKNFLSKSDIEYIYNSGHVIGSHSHSHPNHFYLFNENDTFNELRLSKNILEDIIGNEVVLFSVPFGQTSKLIYQQANKVGYKIIFNSDPSLRIKKQYDMKIVGRMSITNKTTDLDIEKYISGASYNSKYYGRILKKYGRRLIDRISDK